MEPVAILSHTPDLNYASSAALQLLEQELDELRRARQARRLSMFSGSSPSPPLQFKAARRNSDVPSRESTPERPSKPLAKVKEEDNVSRGRGSSVKSSIKVFEEMQSPPSQSVDKPERCDPTEVPDDIYSGTNKTPMISAAKDGNEDQVLERSGHAEVSENISSTMANNEPVIPESKKDEDEESEKREIVQVIENTNSITSKEPANPGSRKDQEKSVNVEMPSTENKPRALQRERKPFRIQTTFDRSVSAEQYNSSVRRESQESTMLLNARRNLKSTPSPPPASVIPSPTKSASALYKLNGADKRASMQPSRSSQTSTNAATNQKRPSKPRPLSDAFIGVKDLSKKFDSTKGSIESLASIRVSNPLLSPESQSVSRERRVSASRPVVGALSQLFNETKKPDQRRTNRQSKPLPPIKVDETVKSNIEEPSAQVMSIPPQSKKAESLRLFHKTMPAIPSGNTEIFKYPNPLPVYMPQLVHPVGETLNEETVEEPNKSTKKRVSFSSVVTSIPPLSPSQYSDDDTSDNKDTQRKPPVAISSAHLLSRWQQQHQMDRKSTNITTTTPRGKSDTRGFWEAFSTEMNNRAAPDLRRVARDQPPPQQMNSPSRFIPSTFANGNKPLPTVSNDKPVQESPVRKNKTWINALQNRLVMKTPAEEEIKSSSRRLWTEQNPPTPNIQNSYRSSASSRKPVSQVSFDEYALPRSNTPPLHHPTKSRPKKPSSFRKHTAQGQMRSNIVGPEVSVPPAAVQRPWYRNH